MKWISNCIKSIVESSISLDAIFIDNVSTDGTREYLQRFKDKFVIIESDKNLGFGRANNIGFKYAIDHQYDYIYLLNQDAWLKKDTIKTLIRVHNLHPEFGILSPMQIQANEDFLDSNFLNNVCKLNNKFIEDIFFHRCSECYEVNSGIAAHWLLSRECVERIGAFSPTFPHYGEDDNYISRAIFHGVKTGIVPTAFAIHDRTNRITSKSKELYLTSYIQFLKNFSNLQNSLAREILIMLRLNTLYLFLYKSFLPIKYTFILITELPKIIFNRKKSKTRGAFLNQ